MGEAVVREDVRMYSVPFEDGRVKELISWYVGELQKAIDIIWSNITWRYDFKGYRRGRGKAKIPVVPKTSVFKKKLRDELQAGKNSCLEVFAD